MDKQLTVRIPRTLANRADKLAANGVRGYSSRADVLSDALRRLFDDIQTEKASA